MAGNIVGLLLSWAILWLVERKGLLTLGFTPLVKRIFQFVLGFFFSGIVCAVIKLAQSSMLHVTWQLNPQITLFKIAHHLSWNFNSVLFEEFIFRGALLYIAIRKLGAVKAILLSAICFGIYHWFSYGLFGNIIPMIVVFVITGLMGWVWAYAFNKTSSMALPIGFHLGWNFTFNAIFSQGFTSDPILILTGGEQSPQLEGIALLANFILQNLLPSILTFLFVKYFIKQEKEKQIPVEKKVPFVLKN
jgi:membrane protease YdiL (CAAX protease family)